MQSAVFRILATQNESEVYTGNLPLRTFALKATDSALISETKS